MDKELIKLPGCRMWAVSRPAAPVYEVWIHLWRYYEMTVEWQVDNGLLAIITDDADDSFSMF